VRTALLAVALAVTLPACSAADAVPVPLVDRIDEAIAATEASYGGPQQYFEISATLDEVRVVVAVDDATVAEQGSLTGGGGAMVFEPLGPATGSTFGADAVSFDQERIFDALRAELDDPVIIDFAITGGENGTVIYDATVASDRGGLLLVLLGPDGRILGVQGE
jgi:hypothetical protein